MSNFLKFIFTKFIPNHSTCSHNIFEILLSIVFLVNSHNLGEIVFSNERNINFL
jgi:hypothetical protein